MTAPEAYRLLRSLLDAAVAERSDAYLLYKDKYKVDTLAHQAVRLFGRDPKKGGRSQMSKLEQVALSAQSYTDVLNYVKRQTGRTTQDSWSTSSFGKDLCDVLTNEVAHTSQADVLHKALSKSEAAKLLKSMYQYDKRDLARELRLRFVQAYIRHLVAHYQFLEAQS